MVFWAACLAAASAAAGCPNCRGGEMGAMSPTTTRAPACAACAIGRRCAATGPFPGGLGGTGLAAATGRFTGALPAAAALGLGATGRTALAWPWPGCSLRGTALAGDGEGRAAALGAACFLASAFFAALLLVVAFRTMSLAHSDLEFSTARRSSSSPDLPCPIRPDFFFPPAVSGLGVILFDAPVGRLPPGRTMAQAPRFTGRPPFLHLGRIPDGGLSTPPGPHAVFVWLGCPNCACTLGAGAGRTVRRGKPRSHAGLSSDFVHAATNRSPP